MKVARKEVNSLCAILIIIMLVVSDMAIIGQAAVSYALDLVKTGSENVSFSAYFVDENGNKVQELERNVSKEEYLYVDIRVEKEGYFDGSISIENSNFRLSEEIVSLGVESIEENTAKLTQITAESTSTIKLKVEAVESENITLSLLNAKTKVSLKGEYYNGRNIERGNSTKINGNTEVVLKLIPDEEIGANLEANVLTNSEVTIKGETKRLIQMEIRSNLERNNYPIKETDIELDLGEMKAEEVRVYKKDTSSTNVSLQSMQEEKLKEENGKYRISLVNLDESSISWKKNSYDELIVTIVAEAGEEVTGKEIKVGSKIIAYNGSEYTAEKSCDIGEEKIGTISYEIKAEEGLYKGMQQTGEAKEYRADTEISVNYVTGVEKVNITEEGKYVRGEREEEGDIVYKETRINKDEMIRVLGEEGFLTIKDGEGRVVGNVNKDSETEEEGKVVIRYSEGTRKIQVETSEAKEIGIIRLENTKEARGEVRDRRAIREKVAGEKGETSKEIELKETETKATIEVSTGELTTLEKNENIKMTVTLLNNEESKDLYRNPELKIKMPRQVRRIDAKCRLLYGNGLELGTAEIREEEGRQVIYLKLNGDQEKYNTEVVEGTTIVIYADIELNERESNSEEKIELEYTNEKYGKAGRDEKDIRIISRAGLIVTNDIGEYGVATLGDEGTKGIVIEEGNRRREATVGIGIINNEESKISNVRVLGRFPTKETDTMGIRVTEGIAIEGAEVYYSDRADATDELENGENGWTREFNSETAKSYLIVKEEVENRERINGSYKISVPANVGEGTVAREDYSVKYVNVRTIEEIKVESTEVELQSESTGLKTEIRAIVGNDVVGIGKNAEEATGEKVAAGEIIKYEVTVRNEGDADLQGIKIEETVPENATAVKYDTEGGQTGVTGIKLKSFYEVPEKNIVFDVETIKAGEKAECIFYLKASNTTENKLLLNTIKTSYRGREVSTKYVANNVVNSDISASIMAMTEFSDEDTIENGKQVVYRMNVINSSNNQINNVDIKFITSDAFEVDRICISTGKHRTEADGYESTENDEYYTAASKSETQIDLKPKENKEIQIWGNIVEKDSKNIELYCTLQNGETIIRTNKIEKNVPKLDLTIDLKATPIEQAVTAKQMIKYDITVNNKKESKDISFLSIEDTISDMVEIEKIELDGEELVEINAGDLTEQDYSIPEQVEGEGTTEPVSQGDVKKNYRVVFDGESDKSIIIGDDFKKGQSKTITITTVVREEALDLITEDYEIVNNVVAKIDDKIVASADDVTHIIKARPSDDEDNPNNPSNPNDPNDPNNQGETDNPNDPSNPNDQNNPNNQGGADNPNGESKVTHSLSGIVWKDDNENGRKENEEQKISGTRVVLVDANTATSKKETTTDANGVYKFTDVEEGKYIVLFDYDTERYVPTLYRADDTTESTNSDAISSRITVDGKELTAATTDTIDLTENKTNMDLGLIDAVRFDLRLDKIVSKVTVMTAQGTESVTPNSDSAKVEINAKYLEGSTVVIEYKIRVTNEGEIAGYAKNIVDYKPSDLEFNSSLNKGWYQADGNLYYSGFANDKIEPGETKEITLVLTKVMTETNTGLVNNQAEITESLNSLGILDKDSIEGNRKKGEDDIGTANVIISIKTGAAINYILFISSVIGILLIIAYIFNNSVIKKRIKI